MVYEGIQDHSYHRRDDKGSYEALEKFFFAGADQIYKYAKSKEEIVYADKLLGKES